jgi:hypothetical protein
MKICPISFAGNIALQHVDVSRIKTHFKLSIFYVVISRPQSGFYTVGDLRIYDADLGVDFT